MRENLKKPAKPETISELIADGNRLLEEESKKKPSTLPAVISKIPKEDLITKNPYQIARHILLKRMDRWFRQEIERMEKTGQIENRFYNEFVAEVAALGDTMS